MDQKKERIEFIDLAKGLCIFLVVYNHVSIGIEECTSPLDNMMFILRMPLYFFLSGLFFKRYNGFFDFSIRKTNVLLIPFLAFHFLTVVAWMVVTDVIGGRFSLSLALLHIKNFFITPYIELLPNQAIWFLLCLFIMNLIFWNCVWLSEKVSVSHSTIVLLIETFLIGIVGYLIGKHNYNIPFYVDSSLTAIPFFSMGYIVRKYTNWLYPNKWDKYNWLFCIICFASSFLLATDKANFWCNRYGNLNVVQLYLGGLLGLSSVLLVAKIVKRVPIISYFGKYSIIILVTHFFWFPYVRRVVDYAHLPIVAMVWITFIITMISYVVIIPLFIRYLPYITAQKPVLKPKE